MVAATQLLNVGRGSHEIAVDLSADQAGTLTGNKNVNVSLQPSTWIFFVCANDDPKVSAVTSNKNFQKAIRYGLDYASLVSLAGKGAIQAPGVIPSMFLGSLPQSARVKTDVAKAKAALEASGVGDQKVTMIYPSDLTINGVPFSSMAQKIQSSLKAVGFNIELSGSPTSNFLDDYRSGKSAFGLSLWGPDYPDPADYLVFTPGQLVGLRAGWPKGGRPGDREARRQGGGDHGARRARGRLPVDPAAAQPERPVLPADPADAGLRGDEGSAGRGLQLGLHRRRVAGVAGVDRLSSFATRAAG